MGRKSYNANFKFRVAVAAIKNDKTIAQICQQFEVSASLVHKWKKAFLEEGEALFSDRNKSKKNADHQAKKIQTLYETVGQLTLERDFLKKSWDKYQEGSD